MSKEATRASALSQLYPAHTLAVSVALLVSTTLLLTGLSLPLLHAQQMIFWKSTYSVWTGVVALWEANELLLATVLLFFSIVFPVAKLAALSVIWFVRLPQQQRARLLHRLELLGKWSMLDVFVVAILIVLVKLGPLAKVEPRAGVYVFAAAIACSMLTTMYVDRLARLRLRSSGDS
jgi:paraquat-inducible protein A